MISSRRERIQLDFLGQNCALAPTNDLWGRKAIMMDYPEVLLSIL